MVGRSELFANVLYKNCSPKKILDVGYAQEPNSYLKGDVYGIDIVEAYAPGYKDTKKVDLNLEKIPYEDGMFDAVVVGCTIAHVASGPKLLGEINRVIKDDGVVLLTTPNPYYYWEIVMNTFYNFFKNRVTKAKHEEHFYSFNRINIETLARRMGFEVFGVKGHLFQLVKTKLKFNPTNFPSIAYEHIYLLRKVGSPKNYTTFEGDGINKIETNYNI